MALRGGVEESNRFGFGLHDGGMMKVNTSPTLNSMRKQDVWRVFFIDIYSVMWSHVELRELEKTKKQ